MIEVTKYLLHFLKLFCVFVICGALLSAEPRTVLFLPEYKGCTGRRDWCEEGTEIFP